jgi:hypothetical protein
VLAYETDETDETNETEGKSVGVHRAHAV